MIEKYYSENLDQIIRVILSVTKDEYKNTTIENNELNWLFNDKTND